MLGSMIGDRYRVIRKLGEGGMAIVYLAVDDKLGRNVAVKFLREKFQSHQDIRTRFQHEARAISGFDHPNILKVYDYSGANSPQLWIVTELIHGRNLGQIVETAPGGWLHPVIAACIVRETCKALALAHSEGIVHRDVKPDNVMITQHGVIKLMDFGIAKMRQNTSMTQTGMFMGSPSYMSPEQVRGRDVDHRSDIYSLGVLFYELITGRLPFSGQSTADVAMKILTGQYQHPRFLKEHLPVEINDLIVSMMSLDPAHRPQSTDTVGGIIDKFLERNGFETSHAELDRCFRDPKSYGERLAKLVQKTVMVALPTQLIQPQSRMDAAMRLPNNGTVGKNQATQKLVQAHNEAAIDRPVAFVPAIPASKTNIAPHPAHAVPPPPARRDHALPRSAIPHISRKAAVASDAMMAHLPERRHQQRPDQPVAKQIKQAQRPQQKAARSEPAQGRHASPPRHQRSLPRVPHRMQARYVVHREVEVAQSYSKFFIFVIVLALGFIFFTLFGEKIHISLPTLPTNVAHTNKPHRIKPVAEPKNQIAQKTAELPKRAEESPLPTPQPEKAVKQKQDPKTERRAEPVGDRKNTITTIPRKPRPSTQPTMMPAAELRPTQKIPVTTVSETVEDDDDEDNSLETSPTIKPSVKPKEPQTGKASLSISANPAAEIFINGRRMGTTNDAGTSSEWLELSSGKIKIELKRSGFTTRTEYISVNPGDKKRLGPFALSRETVKAQPSSYRLTLTTNAPPVTVTIANYETRATKTFILSSSSQTLALDRGIYEVTMQHGSELRKRRIDMTGSDTQITFSAEYKEESN